MASKSKKKSGSSPSTVFIVAGFLVVGALGFFAGQEAGDVSFSSKSAKSGGSNVASVDQNNVPGIVIKPGNPVVAKVKGEDITRLEVLNFIQTLPLQTRQLPVGQIFPVALEQVINGHVINDQTKNVNLDSDPRVMEQLEKVKTNIVRDVYVQNQIDTRLTPERVQEAYESYKARFPDIDEVKARHILVKEKSLAMDLIKQLSAGADFAELAKANSVDGTAEKGGLIGYFSKTEVVPAFAEAAFSADVNKVVTAPVETEFGFHVLLVEESRKRPPASFEQAKPFLEGQLRQLFLNEVVQEWKNQANIERFDINGELLPATPQDQSSNNG